MRPYLKSSDYHTGHSFTLLGICIKECLILVKPLPQQHKKSLRLTWLNVSGNTDLPGLVSTRPGKCASCYNFPEMGRVPQLCQVICCKTQQPSRRLSSAENMQSADMGTGKLHLKKVAMWLCYLGVMGR